MMITVKRYAMTGRMITVLMMIILSSFYLSCSRTTDKQENVISMDGQTFTKGTFGYDLAFLNRYIHPVVLKNASGTAQVVVCPEWQGRVMTSTARGLEGCSFGWINYGLISSGILQEHINAFGGEDRLWLGPEGGQFSWYFKKGSPFDFNNWFVPKETDTEPFDLITSGAGSVSFRKDMHLVNYSGNGFDIRIDRSVSLLDSSQIEEMLGITLDRSINAVAYKGENIITNTGSMSWTTETGMPSIWILDMFSPSPGVTVVIPFRKGPEQVLGKIVTDDYFGKIPSDRLIVGDSLMFFKADGKHRGKLGISPLRALPVAVSYDAENKSLTVVSFTLHEGVTDYVNSLWEIQKDPFSGDAVNSYNDGPLEDGSQMGPFYELESSSPAAALGPGESLAHVHSVFHFQGEEEMLSVITKKILGVSVVEIKNIFK
jgi:hypothetical protein